MSIEQSATSAEAEFEFHVEGTARMLAHSAQEFARKAAELRDMLGSGTRARVADKAATSLLRDIARLSWEAHQVDTLLRVRYLYDTSGLETTGRHRRRLERNQSAARE